MTHFYNHQFLTLFQGRCQDEGNDISDNTMPQQRYLCPPEFLRLGNSCYYLSIEMATWHAAHFACRDRGSQLAALETQWEDTTIRNYIRKPEFGMILYFYLTYTDFS